MWIVLAIVGGVAVLAVGRLFAANESFHSRQRDYQQRSQPAIDEIVATMQAEFPGAAIECDFNHHDGWLGFHVLVASADEETRARKRMEELIEARQDRLGKNGARFDAEMGVSFGRRSPFRAASPR